MCFAANSAKYLRITFLTEHLSWLLLTLVKLNYLVTYSLRGKFSNTEFFLVRIFPHSDWIQENTDQKNSHSDWHLMPQA